MSSTGFVTLLSGEARRELLRIASRKRTYRELARIMGVSPAAVSKYMAGRMNPGDEAVARLLNALDGEEASEAARVLLLDLARGLASLVDWAVTRGALEWGAVWEVLGSLLNCRPARGDPAPTGGGGAGNPTPLPPQRATPP